MTKKILIINGHPNKKGFCAGLSNSYLTGAQKSNADVKLIYLADMEFSPVLRQKNDMSTQLEPDIIMMQEEIKNADHLVFVYPNWWGTYPALLKGFFDRVFLSGFAFKYEKNKIAPVPLLKGKTARVIVTMDTPKWYYCVGYRKPGHNSIKRSILHLCGIRPVRFTTFSPIRTSTEAQRKRWLEKVRKLGELMK